MSSELCLLNEHTGTVWYLLVVVNSFHWNFMENNGKPKVFQHPIRRRSNTTLLPNIVEKPTIFVRCTRASLNAGGNFGQNRQTDTHTHTHHLFIWPVDGMEIFYARNEINEFEKCRTENSFRITVSLPLLIVSYYINKQQQQHTHGTEIKSWLSVTTSCTDICLLLLLSECVVNFSS